MPAAQTLLQAWQFTQFWTSALARSLPVEQIGQDEADGPDVDVAHAVPAHETVHGAHVAHAPAAHAAQSLRQEGSLSTALRPLSTNTTCILFLPSGAEAVGTPPAIHVT